MTHNNNTIDNKMSQQTIESEDTSDIVDEEDTFNESTVLNESMHCQEKSFPRERERSSWHRVPKSKVIVRRHRSQVNKLMRLATENSAKSQTANPMTRVTNPNISQQIDRGQDLSTLHTSMNQPSYKLFRAATQGYPDTKPLSDIYKIYK